MRDEELKCLEEAAERHRRTLDRALLERFPEGTEVDFVYRHAQRNYSTGRVIGLGVLPGFLRIRHHEAKEWGRFSHKDVHYSNVELAEPAGGER